MINKYWNLNLVIVTNLHLMKVTYLQVTMLLINKDMMRYLHLKVKRVANLNQFILIVTNLKLVKVTNLQVTMISKNKYMLRNLHLKRVANLNQFILVVANLVKIVANL